MAKLVQQSTASDPLFFFLTASSDHISALTGATPTVTISKNGAAFAAPAGAVTEIANGWYQVAGNATDTNTLGDILLHATATSGDPCDLVAAQVVAFNPRNSNLGLSNVSANVAQWNGTNVAAPATAGIPDVNVKNYNNVAAATDANNLPKVDMEDVGGVVLGTHAAGLVPSDVRDIAGAAVSTTAAQIGTNVVQYAGATAAVDANNLPKVDMEDIGGVVLGTHAAGLVPADVRDIVGAAVSTTTAQIGTNVVQYAGATAAVDVNNLPKVDIEDIVGAAVNTANAQIGANVVSVAAAASNFKKNTASNGFMFLMTDSTTHAPKTLLTVTATRSLDGAAFAACANAVTEVGVGWYVINFAASDLNGNHIAFRFSATGADDTDIEIITQP